MLQSIYYILPPKKHKIEPVHATDYIPCFIFILICESDFLNEYRDDYKYVQTLCCFMSP